MRARIDAEGNALPPSLRYLGHAGFVVEHAGVRVLMDPWFFPAFLKSWFPYPDNRDLLEETVGERYDYLYVSHAHEDHFDERLLAMLDRSITVLVPKYRSKVMVRRFGALGFEDVVALGHHESFDLGPGLSVTMYLDTSHKEDSGLLLDIDGYRFLDLNDCNTPLGELPRDVDLLAAQYSGAMWYPNCYDYPPEVMQAKVDGVRHDLMDTLQRKVRITGAKTYLPSAGPACFLDPVLAPYNDRDSTIFPLWEQVADSFSRACPNVEILRVGPGALLELEPSARAARVSDFGANVIEEDFAGYRDRRRAEWSEFDELSDDPITSAELEAYFRNLQRRNKRFLADFRKDIVLIAGSNAYAVRLGRLAENFVIEGEEPYDVEYTVVLPTRVLRAIIEGRTGWEEALLSMRISLRRIPDIFDVTFMSLLRYGNHPVQTMQLVRERQNTETIERDGLRLQRFCPHAGEDLTFADIRNGFIECPRHHWIWDARTGRCVDKGMIDLRVEVLDPDSPALTRGSETDAANGGAA